VSSYDRIYRVIMRIPRGRVTTYGSVARLAGLAGQPRLVGYALHTVGSGAMLPWHRVINAQGKLSLEAAGASSGLTQRMRLQQEGVIVNAAGRVDLTRFGWEIDAKARRTAPVAKKKTAKKVLKRSAVRVSEKKSAKSTAAKKRAPIRTT
jgi:methylated-DNA-protein-cysteine methyltransferase-like protein